MREADPSCETAVLTELAQLPRPDDDMRELLRLPSTMRPADIDRLGESRVGYAPSASGPPADTRLLALAYEIACRVADTVDGIVMDIPATTFRPRSADGWLAALEQPVTADIGQHITRHATERRGAWVYTHGIAKYGQPDLQIALAFEALLDAADDFLLAAGQALVDAVRPVTGPRIIDVPDWGAVALLGGTDRHYDGPVYRIMLASDHPRRLLNTQGRLYGRSLEADPMAVVAADDPRMLEAAAQARATLDDLAARYADPEDALRRGIDIAVKAGFPLDDPSEYMWVQVTAWGDPLTGRLVNQPNCVPGLTYGQEVKVPCERVCDWCATLPDGTMEGDFTSAVLAGEV